MEKIRALHEKNVKRTYLNFNSDTNGARNWPVGYRNSRIFIRRTVMLEEESNKLRFPNVDFGNFVLKYQRPYLTNAKVIQTWWLNII